MAIHGKQLKNASIDLSKLEGIAASPAADKLLLSATAGAAQLLSVGGNLQASVSGTTLDLQIVDGTVTFTNLADAAVIKESEGIQSNDNDTTIPTSAAVKDYVDAQVSASGSALELSAGTGSASIALATETLTVTGGANISTVASSTLNSLTVSLDSHISLTSATLSGALSVGGSAVIAGDLTVNGTTTTVNSTTVTVDDKNLELGSVASPSDTTADGGGITLKGATDKTFNWVDATDAWTSSEHMDLASGKSYYIGGTELLAGTGVKKIDLQAIGGTGNKSGLSVDTNNELSLDINTLAAVTTLDPQFDTIVIGDSSNSNVTKRLSFANVSTAIAGEGIKAASGVLSLDLNELTSATVDVTNDSIAFIDADDNSSKKQSVSGLAAAMAGTGITATNGVLSVTSPELSIISITPDATTGGGAGNLINVSGSSYTLPSTPSGEVHLFVNGVAQEPGSATTQGDYFVNSSDKIEWNSSDFDLEATDKIIISYVPA